MQMEDGKERSDCQYQACFEKTILPCLDKDTAIIQAQRMGYGSYVQVVQRQGDAQVIRAIVYINEDLLMKNPRRIGSSWDKRVTKSLWLLLNCLL